MYKYEQYNKNDNDVDKYHQRQQRDNKIDVKLIKKSPEELAFQKFETVLGFALPMWPQVLN